MKNDELSHESYAAVIGLATDPAERYLAMLAWVARQHAADFADFISHQPSAQRYLRLSRTEVDAIRHEHQVRQIDGTQYWAVMNIDDVTKGRFVRRLLEFIGSPDETVAETLRLLALPPGKTGARSAVLSVG